MVQRTTQLLGGLALALLFVAATACERASEPPAAAAQPAAVDVAMAEAQTQPPTPAAAPSGTPPRPSTQAVLTGDVVDYHGRPLPGTLVTAHDDLRGRTVSVYTDGHGKYAFPPLDTGTWRVLVRVIGSERRERTIQLGEDGLDADFQLRLAEAPYEQLPASYYYDKIEWPTEKIRANFALACANCHQIGDPLWRKERTREEWEAVIARMEFRGPPLLEESRAVLVPKMVEAFRSYTEADFEMPSAPTGDATRAILWEYEVDPEGRNGCHDLEIGLDGRVYTEDGFVVDPETMERQRFDIPRGSHSIEMAPDGNMWMTVTGKDLITKLDVETGEITNYEHPQHGDDKGVYPHTLRFDDKGRIWYTLTVSNHVAVFDPATEEFTYYDLPGAMNWDGPVPIPVAYGLDVAPDQTVWWSQLLTDTIGVLDPETGEIRSWQTPVHGPRRLRVGADGVVWVPGYGSSSLGRFDPKTETWKVYPLPTEPAGSELPYALSVNRNTGDVWVAGSNSDTLIRFDPETETFTSYALATPVDFTREIEFDDENNIWTCAPDRGTGPEGPLSGRFIKLTLLEREGSCGDGEIQLGEQCDDSNTAAGDGCSSQCTWEPQQTASMQFKD